VAVFGIAIALIEAAAVLVVIHQPPRRVHPVPVEPGIGEYFVPQPAGRFFAPVSAADAFTRLNGRPAPIPRRDVVRYGLLTMPTGPNGRGGLRYQYKDRPVWAFTTPGCTTLGAMPIRLAGPCLTWQFIDSRTGQDLGGVG
jgi:hypothetical protein